MNILGISAFYHDSAACLIQDGRIVAAAQEERFTRKKHDACFPFHAIRFCLTKGGVQKERLDAVTFYDKPILKFGRILEAAMHVAPKGLAPFVKAMPVWLRQKLWIPMIIESNLEKMGIANSYDLFFPEHHESHAASAFLPSPFQHAAIMTVDGVGEWATSTLCTGKDNRIEIIRELQFPHSLGLLYSAFTYYCGFRVNSGEYKLMGLAPYGRARYVQKIYDHLIDLKADGSFKMNMTYFGYLDSLRMTNAKFEQLFDGPARQPESEITQREMDIARSIQVVTEEIVLRMARYLHQVSSQQNLCLAGGVALNCVANGRLLTEGPFEKIWIQPAAGDAGGALGAALFVWHQLENKPRRADGSHDQMNGTYLGPEFEDTEIEAYLQARNYPADHLSDDAWAQTIAELIDRQKVVGLFQGPMEFGPRALGGRSIIGDARSDKMQSQMNLKIKYRESFRPFAPSCLQEQAAAYFELDRPSPYMLLVSQVRPERCIGTTVETPKNIHDRIHQVRSDVPAITHVDHSARVQTVDGQHNRRYYELIRSFYDRTGCGLIINTSFNVRGEPIVCTPEDAYRCFMRTEMDYLVLGSFLLDKNRQPAWQEKTDWRSELELD